MALSVFDDKSKPPRPAEVAEALGRTSRLWDEIISTLAAEYDPLIEEWKYSFVYLIRHKKLVKSGSYC